MHSRLAPSVPGLPHLLPLFVILSLFRCLSPAAALPPPAFTSITNHIGLVTNRSAILDATVITSTSTSSGIFTNAAGRLIRRPVSKLPQVHTNWVFDRFLPNSLHYHVLTNIADRTNGHTTKIWRERSHPNEWPRKPPIVSWDTDNVMWGMMGLTALSPCWQGEGSPGQVPVTALTRRHGYTRGHSLGNEGFHKNFHNFKVWFLATNNDLVEVKVLREVTWAGTNGDYTILLFDRDLPASIQPFRVVDSETLQSKYPLFSVQVPRPMFLTEQSGNVSACLPGFSVAAFKGGDSGSPNLLPLDNELIFTGGRATSTANRHMQADMDELCRLAGLKPDRYQMKWKAFARFPRY